MLQSPLEFAEMDLFHSKVTRECPQIHLESSELWKHDGFACWRCFLPKQRNPCPRNWSRKRKSARWGAPSKQGDIRVICNHKKISRMKNGDIPMHFCWFWNSFCLPSCLFSSTFCAEYAVVTADFNPDKLRIFEQDFFITQPSYMSTPIFNGFWYSGAIWEE